jgi:predicted helicase
METADEKISFLANNAARSLNFDEVQPDKAHNWINLSNNDFETLLPLANKGTKAAKTAAKERAIFKLYSLGVSTNRDDWVYDYSSSVLGQRMKFFIDQYLIEQKINKFSDKLKWSRNLKRRSQQGKKEPFNAEQIRISNYRPFVRAAFYDSRLFIDERGSVDSIFPSTQHQQCFGTIGDATDKPFSLLAAEGITDLNYLSPAAAGTKLFSLYRYDEAGNRVDNITDWGLKQFTAHYKEAAATGAHPSTSSGRTGAGKEKKITKETIFHYCYAVLHDPLYREKYALNLKREFPRIPFYENFWQWAAWGEALMKLHIGYESVEPFKLKRTDIPDEKVRAAGLQPKALLRADKDANSITLDSETTLRGIPPEAWDYKLGNRCALEWVLDQYKEKKPKDPTIREKFDTYRFVDYKEKVIDLLARVTTVSVETERITQAMKAAAR